MIFSTAKGAIDHSKDTDQIGICEHTPGNVAELKELCEGYTEAHHGGLYFWALMEEEDEETGDYEYSWRVMTVKEDE